MITQTAEDYSSFLLSLSFEALKRSVDWFIYSIWTEYSDDSIIE